MFKLASVYIQIQQALDNIRVDQIYFPKHLLMHFLFAFFQLHSIRFNLSFPHTHQVFESQTEITQLVLDSLLIPDD